MDEQLWGGVVHEIAQLTNSMGGILLCQSQRHNALLFTHQSNVSDDAIRLLSERHVLNPWTMHMWRYNPVGTVVPSDRILPLSELRRTEFFDDVLRPQGASHSAMLGLAQKPDFGVGFSLNRTARQGPYGDRDLQLLDALSSHLRRSVQLGFRVDAYKALQRNAYETLDHLAIGIILLDRRAKILFANAAARALDGPGAPLRLGRGSVSHALAFHGRRIHDLVQQALHGAPITAISVPRPDDGYPLTILATPMRGREVDRLADASLTGAAVLLFIFDPASKAGIPPGWLMESHGLTHAEANVAIAVSTHGTIPDTARALNLSPNTIKTHLRNVFAKIGIGHQADLSRLIASLRTVHRAGPPTDAPGSTTPPRRRR